MFTFRQHLGGNFDGMTFAIPVLFKPILLEDSDNQTSSGLGSFGYHKNSLLGLLYI